MRLPELQAVCAEQSLQDRTEFLSLSAGQNSLVVGGSFSRMLRELSRGEYFAGLFVVGCASGLASRIIYSINERGWADALFGSFGISVIVWISCIGGTI